MSMELNEYQEKAMSTCLPSCNNFAYMSLGLVSEVGELAGKVAKAVRKEEIMLEQNDIFYNGSHPANDAGAELHKGLIGELGDVLWFVSGICNVLGLPLEDVADANLAKLAERKKNGTIIGNGDGVTKEERR